MDNLNDLKAIWLTAKTDDLPRPKEMLRIVKKFRNDRLRKKIVIIVLSLAIIALLIVTGAISGSSGITTITAEILTIAACAILVFTNTRSMKRFIHLKDCSNREFLEFLEQTRRNQAYYYKITQVWGMALSSAGLLLYLWEPIRARLTLGIILYAVAIAWILFLWLYLRPRNFKRQGAKLNETIKRLEKIEHQINEDEQE